MEKINYQLINDYFNSLSLNLFESKELEENYDNFIVLNDFFYNYFGKRYFVENHYHVETRHNNMTFQDVVDIAKEVIESFDSTFAQIFDNLLDNGILDFSFEGQYYDSHVEHVYHNGKKLHSEININRSFNYSDVEVLVHEFIHYMCFMGTGIRNKIISEFMSIYFELYAIEYMYKKYKFDLEELFYNRRLVNVFYHTCRIIKLEVPLYIYKSFGDLDENSYKNELGFLTNYTKEKYEHECREVEKIIKNINDGTYDKCVIEEDHYYTMATFLAFYVGKKKNVNDILYFLKNVNREENLDKDILELLSSFNMGIEEDIKQVLEEALDEFLDQFEENKKQR